MDCHYHDCLEKIKKYDFGENWCFSDGCTWPPELGKHGFSPEMDVSGRDKKKLKSGAPNFEKQKNESIFKFHTKMSKYQGNLGMKKKHAYMEGALASFGSCVPQPTHCSPH